MRLSSENMETSSSATSITVKQCVEQETPVEIHCRLKSTYVDDALDSSTVNQVIKLHGC